MVRRTSTSRSSAHARAATGRSPAILPPWPGGRAARRGHGQRPRPRPPGAFLQDAFVAIHGARPSTARRPSAAATARPCCAAPRDGRPLRRPPEAAAADACAWPSGWSSTSPATWATASPTSSRHPGETAEAALAHFCRHPLGARYPNARTAGGRPHPHGGGAGADRPPRPGRLLPAAPGDPRARARGGLRVRPAGSARRWLPPGRGRGSSVGSIVCYLTGLSHIDPVENRLFLGRFLSRDMVSVPDIDLDFPRDIRERADRGRHRALRPRARRAGGGLPHLPHAHGRTRAGQGPGPARGRPRPPVPAGRRMVHAGAVEEELAACPTARQAALPALARPGLPGPRGGRPPPPPLAALGGDGGERPPAGGARPGGPGRLSRPPDLPVGQGLLRRRRVREDRPAGPGDALGGRGLRGPDRAHPRADGRPLADRLHRPRGLRRDPGRRHGRGVPDREPGADAEPAADPPREPGGPDHPGRPHPPRAGHRRCRAPLRAPPPRPARGPLVRAPLRPPPARRLPSRHAGRGRLPGAGARGGDGAGRLHARARPRRCGGP